MMSYDPGTRSLLPPFEWIKTWIIQDEMQAADPPPSLKTICEPGAALPANNPITSPVSASLDANPAISFSFDLKSFHTPAILQNESQVDHGHSALLKPLMLKLTVLSDTIAGQDMDLQSHSGLGKQVLYYSKNPYHIPNPSADYPLQDYKFIDIDQSVTLHQQGVIDVDLTRIKADIDLVVDMDAMVDQDASITGVIAAQFLKPDPVPFDEAPSISQDVALSQNIEIYQDASVAVSGWYGKIVTNVAIDQDIDLDQDFDVSVGFTGKSGLSIAFDQDMIIDHNLDVDIDIYEDNGTLYIAIDIEDDIDIDQDTGLEIGDDGFSLTIDQDITLIQSTDLNVEIEDELEDSYDITVIMNVRQTSLLDQDVRVDITADDNAINITGQADHTASLDQDVTIKIDFAVV